MCIVAKRLRAGRRSGPYADYRRERVITDTNGEQSNLIKSALAQPGGWRTPWTGHGAADVEA